MYIQNAYVSILLISSLLCWASIWIKEHRTIETMYSFKCHWCSPPDPACKRRRLSIALWASSFDCLLPPNDRQLNSLSLLLPSASPWHVILVFLKMHGWLKPHDRNLSWLADYSTRRRRDTALLQDPDMEADRISESFGAPQREARLESIRWNRCPFFEGWVSWVTVSCSSTKELLQSLLTLAIKERTRRDRYHHCPPNKNRCVCRSSWRAQTSLTKRTISSTPISLQVMYELWSGSSLLSSMSLVSVLFWIMDKSRGNVEIVVHL